MDEKENRDYKKKERKKERNAKFTKIACYALRVFLFFYIKRIFFAANENSHISKERQKRNYSIKKVLYRWIKST